MTSLLAPILRSLAQITDPAFIGIVLRSLLWSALVFAGLHVGVIWAVHHVLSWHGWLAWLGDLLGGIGASLLGLWLFLPLAALIATLFIDRVARAVERRHYPALPPAPGSSLVDDIRDGLALAWRILLLNLLALVLVLVVPGLGLILAWVIAAYAIGRGLFMAVALRRFDRARAERMYADCRGLVLIQGGVLALAGYVPLMNLLVPVVGAAAMVHVLDAAQQRPGARL